MRKTGILLLVVLAASTLAPVQAEEDKPAPENPAHEELRTLRRQSEVALFGERRVHRRQRDLDEAEGRVPLEVPRLERAGDPGAEAHLRAIPRVDAVTRRERGAILTQAAVSQWNVHGQPQALKSTRLAFSLPRRHLAKCQAIRWTPGRNRTNDISA